MKVRECFYMVFSAILIKLVEDLEQPTTHKKLRTGKHSSAPTQNKREREQNSDTEQGECHLL